MPAFLMKHRTLGKRHCSLKSLKELGLPKSKLTLRFVLALAQKRIFSVKIQRGKFWCQFLSARTEEQKKAFWLETWQTGKVCSWPRTGRLCNRRWTPPRTLLVPVCLAVVRLVKFSFCREPKGYFKNSPTPAILTGKVGDGSCLLLLLFFKFIHVLFIQSHRLLPLLYTTHFGKKNDLWLLSCCWWKGGLLASVIIIPVVSCWEHCILNAAVVTNYVRWKPGSMQGFIQTQWHVTGWKWKGTNLFQGDLGA